MGKAEQKSRTISLRQLACICMPAVLLLGLMVVSVTQGFLTSHDNVRNNFDIGENTSHIEEEFGEYEFFEEGHDYTKKVQVQNDGSVPCYVRAFAEVEDPYTREEVEIDFDTEHWSEKKADGYRYYNEILPVGEQTAPLFTKITAKEDVYFFSMICYSETVQAEGFSDAEVAFRALK